MNSYPPELLTQLAPVMFVGGLDPPPASGKTTDPFVVLSHRLREALVNQRKVAIWQPDKAKTFQVVLVDKVRYARARCATGCNNAVGRPVSSAENAPARRPAI